MANPLKGEAQLAAGELGRFVLRFDCNALAELQAAWGLQNGLEGDQKFLSRLFLIGAAGFGDVRVALFFALQTRHADKVKDLRDAGQVVDASTVPAVRKALSEAVILAFPEFAKEISDTGGDGPPKGESPGTGPA